MNQLSLILPYWMQPKMLRKQLNTIAEYPPEIEVIVVDDCSEIPAESVLEDFDKISLYRVTERRDWNRSMCRNLGAKVAETPWIIQVDTDHVLPPDAAARLLEHGLNPGSWYRFPRFRVGKADETRNKDAIPRDQEYGQIHEHTDSYLITKANYWRTGGYDPDYAGCLGGGGAFLARLEKMLGPSASLPIDIHLEVHTRHSIPDASVSGLNRDTSEYKRRKKEKEARGDTTPKNPIRYPYERVR